MCYNSIIIGKEKPTMRDTENHVVTKWAPQWKQLGRQLNVDQSLINIIQHDHGNDCVECCSRMLEAWLEQNTHDTTTWETLIKAIDNLPIDLKGSYCVGFAQLTKTVSLKS